MTITDTSNLILQITDKLTLFLQTNIQTEKDFLNFEQQEMKNKSTDEKRRITFAYLYTRKISGKNIFDYYLSKTLNLTQNEINIINALKTAFTGVFEIKKILKNGFELYSLINERDYTVNAIGTMTAFRGAYQGAFLYCCLCKIDNEYYVFDTRGITGSDKTGGAQRYAISKIIENPDIVFFDNEEKLSQIKEQINYFEKRFFNCFLTYEVITTNKHADTLINAFNDYCDFGNENIKEIIKEGVKQPDTYRYFSTKDFVCTEEEMTKKSMAGFSAIDDEYDVGIIFVKNSGLYAIPFYATFCQIFENENYKNIENYKDCVINFLKNDKIPSVVIDFAANKYENFADRISEIIGKAMSYEEIIKTYKPNPDNKPIISTASILYSSKVFGQIMIKEIKDEEEENNKKEQIGTDTKKIGRNEPCPCGSGKKYKKCCGNKKEDI